MTQALGDCPCAQGNRFVSVPRDLITRAFNEWPRWAFDDVCAADEWVARASKVWIGRENKLYREKVYLRIWLIKVCASDARLGRLGVCRR